VRRILPLLILLATAPAARGTILGFEDAPTSRDGFLVGSYGGLDWDGSLGSYFQILDTTSFCRQASLPGPAYCKGTVSGTHVAFDFDATQVRSATPFDFIGTYITAGFRDDMRVRVQGFRAGALVFDRLVPIDTSGPTWFAFDFTGIDLVEFRPDPPSHPGNGTHFVIDDFEFRFVPEPGTALVLALGLTLLSGSRRFRKTD